MADPTAGYRTPPSQGPYAGFNPQDFFGSSQTPFFQNMLAQQGPFSRQSQNDPYGAGMYGLPEAFAGWTGPARYALGPAMSYSQQAQPAMDMYRKQMGTDWTSTLYGQSADVINAQSQAAQRTGQQRLAQAGYGGGGTISPFAGLQVQQENLARMGQLGSAARMSVLQGQQMQAEAGRNYLNSLAQNMQALLTPAQLEVSRQAKVPTSGGVSYIGPALNAAAAGLGAYAGA
jgi:hypothetical protein